MSAFSEMIKSALASGVDPFSLFTGKSVDEHANTDNPLWQSFGTGSRHHASAAEGLAERTGFLPSQIGGALVELAEGIGNPQGFMGHMSNPDTRKDIIANLAGGVQGSPGVPEGLRKALLNLIVPALQNQATGKDQEMPGVIAGLQGR